MKFENTEVFNFDGAIRGMRNPLESWDKSDSDFKYNYDEGGWCSKDLIIGENDLKLMQSLIRAGSEHRKFMRQIFISVDITAPMFYWLEFDTYKIGTVSNSTSKMHKLISKPITIDCFEFDDFDEEEKDIKKYWTENLIPMLESLRQETLLNKEYRYRYWKELIRLLPESWLQKRTITMNYENVLSMIHQRKNHKLTEWSETFIAWAKELPYADELLFLEK